MPNLSVLYSTRSSTAVKTLLLLLIVCLTVIEIKYDDSDERDSHKTRNVSIIISNSSSYFDKNIRYNTLTTGFDWYWIAAYLDHRLYPTATITIHGVRRTQSKNVYFKCIRLSMLNDSRNILSNVSAEELGHYDGGIGRVSTRTLKFKAFQMNILVNTTFIEADILSSFSSDFQNHFADENVYRLKLRYIPPLTKIVPKYNFALCIGPAYGNLTAERYIEFIEINRILGADHFYIYDYTAGKLNAVLHQVWNYYKRNDTENKSLVSVIKWNLPPFSNESDVFYYLQMLQIQHCLYQAIPESRYTLFHDLDEILVPRDGSTWSTFVAKMNFHGNDKRCALCIPMFYFKQSAMNKSDFRPAYFTDIQPSVVNYNNGKCLTRTAYAYELHVHNVRACIDGYFSTFINSFEASIHHYYDHFCSHQENQNNRLCTWPDRSNTNLLKYENLTRKRTNHVKRQLGLSITW